MITPQDVAMKEIEAMKIIANALSGLEEESISRILRWATDMYCSKEIPKVELGEDTEHQNKDNKNRFNDIAEIFEAASPTADADKALLAGYWFQNVNEEPDFDAQSINRELKHLGHRVSNITVALNRLINQKPQLAIQTRKSGTSQQARKKYKLTSVGRKTAEEMIYGAYDD